MPNNIWYAVFDARYNYDPDAALVLDTSNDLEGAWESAKAFGSGNVVVKMKDKPDGLSYPIEEYFHPSEEQQK